MDGLVTREVASGEQLILPLWHNVTRAKVMSYSSSLADKTGAINGGQLGRPDRGRDPEVVGEAGEDQGIED